MNKQSVKRVGIARTPVDPRLREQVTAALASGNTPEAERLLRRRVMEAPGDFEAMISLADIVAPRSDEEAIGLLDRAVAIAPDAHNARLTLSSLHQKKSHFPPALEQLRMVPENRRSSFELKAREAALLGSLGRRDEEIAILEKLTAEQPANPVLRMTLGIAYSYAGESKQAVESLEKAIELAPRYGEPWWTLANLKSYRFSDNEIATMEQRLRDDLLPIDALHFHFALGRALEQRGEYQGSFDHYTAGNRLRAATLNPVTMRVTGFVDSAIATYTAPLFQRLAGSGAQSDEPIFVIGLQRSGSTLLEQILASHPEVEATNELMTMQHLSDALAARAGGNVFKAISRADPGTFRQIGEEYLERTRPFRLLGRRRFVDKLPANWMHVGLIRLALPNATIIDARRQPMACGFSNFKQHYAVGVNFTYSLASIGDFYRNYWRMMQHFDRVQPGKILHVIHEDLVDDPEREIRRVLDFAGLAFDPACLDFHRNKRAVHTPSAEQVRQPISRDGLESWRNYEPWLSPLKDALGPALAGWRD